MRVEFGSDVKITIVTPGFIESELTQGKFLSHEGKMVIDHEARDVSYFFLTSVNNMFYFTKS